MNGLKDLLGESFREDISISEIDKILKSKNLVDKNTLPKSQFTKEDFDKLSSQIADFKRKEREKLSEDEKNRAELIEQIDSLKLKLENSEKENKLSNLKSKYLSLGYTEDLAINSAMANIEQNYDKLFEYQQKFLEINKEKITKDIFSNTPRPENVSNKSLKPNFYEKLENARKQNNHLEATRIIEEAFESGITIR